MADPTAAKEADAGNDRASEPGPGWPPPIRITRELELSAAARLTGDAAGPRGVAARRMVTAAALHGIDLSWIWATVDRSAGRPTRVRQACLVVPGSGKTAMCVLSGPGGGGSADQEHFERVSCIREAVRFLGQERQRPGGRDIRLAQALPDPSEPWATRAYLDAGFTRVGELAYMRRQKTSGPEARDREWPPGFRVRRVRGIGPVDADREVLLRTLERTYEATLDCPELCGLRETADVLESHRATGAFDPSRWWLLFEGERPCGCMLLNRCPDHGTIELVYLGLAPEVRGRGLGAKLMEMGLAQIDAAGGTPMTCAVDLRNAPAIKLYERLGFRQFGQRTALVMPTGERSDSTACGPQRPTIDG